MVVSEMATVGITGLSTTGEGVTSGGSPVAVAVAVGDGLTGVAVGLGLIMTTTWVEVAVGKAVTVGLRVAVGVWVGWGLSAPCLGLGGWGVRLQAVIITMPRSKITGAIN